MNSELEKELENGRLYARLPNYQYHLRWAHRAIQKMLFVSERPYLALSFGKQSIVLAHMIYEVAPQTPMLFMSSWESYLLHNFEDVIEAFTSRYPINLTIVNKDNVSWNDWDWKATRDHGQQDLQTFADDVLDWDGLFMGLAKEESFARRVSLSKANTPYRGIYKYRNGKYRCCPIQNWGLMELAAYIATHDLPLLDAYKNGLEARTTARITRNTAEMNGLIDLKQRDIAAYNKICARFPELKAKA